VAIPFPPIEPPRTRVRFPDPRDAGDDDVIAVGTDFSAGTLLEAYRNGIFPWPHPPRGVLWCSMDPRAIFPIDDPPHWSRSLRRTLRHHPYAVTIDEAFTDVMVACGETRERKNATWIIPELVLGYARLHQLGWAHSVEVWDTAANERELVGGIYGVAIGGVFAGESMFHTRTDASKIAFASLVEKLRSMRYELFDVQVQNAHLESLGCIEIERDDYLDRVRIAVTRKPAAW
jgi:leucyl/phenylalanyl-tRNA--protein transferase